jgi:hypothetical protein
VWIPCIQMTLAIVYGWLVWRLWWPLP